MGISNYSLCHETKIIHTDNNTSCSINLEKDIPSDIIYHVFNYIELITMYKDNTRVAQMVYLIVLKTVSKRMNQHVMGYLKSIFNDHSYNWEPLFTYHLYIGEVLGSDDHLNLLGWLQNMTLDFDDILAKVYPMATEKGKLEILKHVRKKDNFYDKDICEDAAKDGHLSILKWMHENGHTKGNTSSIADFAADHGHLAILIWAINNKFSWDGDSCTYFEMNELAGLSLDDWVKKNELK